MTIFFQDLDRVFYIQDNKEHKTTIRSEAERVIDRTLPVCHPLTEIMGVQYYRSYEAFLLGSVVGCFAMTVSVLLAISVSTTTF